MVYQPSVSLLIMIVKIEDYQRNPLANESVQAGDQGRIFQANCYEDVVPLLRAETTLDG